MVHGVSVSTLTTSGNTGVYGSNTLCRNHSKLMNKSQMNSGLERHHLWHQSILGLFLTSHRSRIRQKGLRVQAGWLFKGSDQGMDASAEQSESANEDILIFFFQLDLATRVQCALNMEQYDIAKQLRNKLTEVEAEVITQRKAKRGSNSKSEAQDKAISILRLRTDMQKAIENENYALAAELRDEMSKLEAESLAASAKALVYEHVQYAFRLGQKVRHKMFESNLQYCLAIRGVEHYILNLEGPRYLACVQLLGTKLRVGNRCLLEFFSLLKDLGAPPPNTVLDVSEPNWCRFFAKEGPLEGNGDSLPFLEQKISLGSNQVRSGVLGLPTLVLMCETKETCCNTPSINKEWTHAKKS